MSASQPLVGAPPPYSDQYGAIQHHYFTCNNPECTTIDLGGQTLIQAEQVTFPYDCPTCILCSVCFVCFVCDAFREHAIRLILKETATQQRKQVVISYDDQSARNSDFNQITRLFSRIASQSTEKK